MAFEACPSPMSHIIIEHLHGAATRVPVDEHRVHLRTTGFNVVIISQWTSADETERGIAWARDTFSALTPFSGADALPELSGSTMRVEPAAVAYGPNLPRLRQSRTKWDPDNFFRQNVNIPPLAAMAT